MAFNQADLYQALTIICWSQRFAMPSETFQINWSHGGLFEIEVLQSYRIRYEDGSISSINLMKPHLHLAERHSEEATTSIVGQLNVLQLTTAILSWLEIAAEDERE